MTRFYNIVKRAIVGGTTSIGLFGSYRYKQTQIQHQRLPTDTLTWEVGKNPDQSSVVIVGGGVVGVTAAYKLAKAGHSVLVLEPRDAPALECSSCAAGGMQRANPVVDRDTWISVLKCLLPSTRLIFGGSEESFKFFNISWSRTLSDPFFMRWLWTFMQTSLFPDPDQADKQNDMLEFTNFSVNAMKELITQRRGNMVKACGYNPTGSLSVSYDDPTPSTTAELSGKEGTCTHMSTKNSYEPHRVLNTEEILSMEPSLRFQEKKPVTAKFEMEASAASSERFTIDLESKITKDKNMDVEFFYGTTVKEMTVETAGSSGLPRISEIRTNHGVLTVPENAKVLVAAGSWTPHVLALLGLYAPVYPLKGYAMSVNAKKALAHNRTLNYTDLPSRIVSDKYMFTSRLGDEIRITSIGEFSGWSTEPTAHVDAEFRREAIRQFPQLKDLIEIAETKCGHRPYVSDGILLLGKLDTYQNLLISCGPGSNGWKLAVGSAEIIERLVSGNSEEQITKDLGFNVNSFSPSGRVTQSPLFSMVCRSRWNV